MLDAVDYGGDLECVKYLHENGCLWHRLSFGAIVAKMKEGRGRKNGLAKYMFENGCPLDDNIREKITTWIEEGY